MTNRLKMLCLAGACALSLVLASTANAATINVLWYTGGTEASGPGTYEANVANLVGQAATGGQNPTGATTPFTWNVTFWTGGPKPAGTFNVLVAASQEGFWSTNPNYASLTAAFTGGTVPLGNRIMVTGQDADWHYMNSPGPTNFNNPQGFLIDAIDWAGTGTGTGAVFLSVPSSVLLAGLGPTLFAGLGLDSGSTENVVIPPAFASFPINTGLTSAGLSNWGTSAHDIWTGTNASLWTQINVNDSVPGAGVTLVSAATAGGGFAAGIPEPSSMLVFGLLTAAGLGYYRRRKAAV